MSLESRPLGSKLLPAQGCLPSSRPPRAGYGDSTAGLVSSLSLHYCLLPCSPATPGALDAFNVTWNSQCWTLKAPEAPKGKPLILSLFLSFVFHCPFHPGGTQNPFLVSISEFRNGHK